jgi:hypothetical protein
LRAHLIWFGSQFPWVNLLAVRSAALRGGFERVVLHHDSDLSGTPYYRELLETPRVELARLAPEALFSRCGRFSATLTQTFSRLGLPAVRADLVRLALLYADGGVYLDTDTVTIASLRPLCESAQAFCGEERIVYPAQVRTSRNPAVRGAALARQLLRDVLRRAPRGYHAFAAVQRFYPAALNNAVLASAPGGAFVTRLLEDLVALPVQHQAKLYTIGPHLLQTAARAFLPPELRVLPPPVFYPLGPEICEHWFRTTTRPDLTRVLSPETRIVHWYRSNRTQHLTEQINPDYVRAHADCQLFSALALPFVSS